MYPMSVVSKLLPRPYQHRSLEDVLKSLRRIGEFIAEEGTPEPTGPFIIAVTGNGNVAKGALHVLNNLPVRHISIGELHNLAIDPSGQPCYLQTAVVLISVVDPDRRHVYLLHVRHQDYLRDKTGKPFHRETYYNRPDQFESTFAEEVRPQH
jgi:alpha-aminoadipic semialdehyde synthase